MYYKVLSIEKYCLSISFQNSEVNWFWVLLSIYNINFYNLHFCIRLNSTHFIVNKMINKNTITELINSFEQKCKEQLPKEINTLNYDNKVI